jgi:hypothetical protein
MRWVRINKWEIVCGVRVLVVIGGSSSTPLGEAESDRPGGAMPLPHGIASHCHDSF